MLKDRIERIIEIKQKMMDNKEREIEEQKNKLDALVRSIMQIKSEIDQNYDRITSTSLHGNDLSVITDYVEHLEKKKYAVIIEKESLEEKIIIMKSELLYLLKEFKTLGALKDKIAASLKKFLNRQEQKLLDDIALRSEERR